MKERAPEEQFAWTMDSYPLIDLRKSDCYMMANVMYYVLTNRWLFEGYNTRQTVEAMSNGRRSEFPLAIQNSDDAAIQTMKSGIELLWTQDPAKRPTANEISNYFMEELQKQGAGFITGDVRVSVPPLPPEWRFTESDFLDNVHPSSSDENKSNPSSDENEGSKSNDAGSDDV